MERVSKPKTISKTAVLVRLSPDVIAALDVARVAAVCTRCMFIELILKQYLDKLKDVKK